MQPVPPLKNREHAEEKAAFLHGKQGKHLFGEVLNSTNFSVKYLVGGIRTPLKNMSQLGL